VDIAMRKWGGVFLKIYIAQALIGIAVGGAVPWLIYFGIL
jgi:hypothetical protein